MTFPRTPNAPLVSVLLPTRGRPEYLTHSIASLHNLATDKGALEFLLYIDEDDEATIGQALHLIRAGLNLRFLVGKRLGYARHHEMTNPLAAVATGDWLLLWNDDAVMRTDGWDQRIATAAPPAEFKGAAEIAMLGMTCPGYSPWVFFAIRRGGHRTLGHFSRHCCNDTYLEKVYRPLGAYFTIDAIHVDHYQNEIIDETRQGSVALPPSDWDGGWLAEAIETDRMVLARHLEERK